MYPEDVRHNGEIHQLGDIINFYDPMALVNLIKKRVLAQTEEQYASTIVYEQEPSLYGFHHNTLKSDHWYEKFNTKGGCWKHNWSHTVT